MNINAAKKITNAEDVGIVVHIKDAAGVKEYYGKGDAKRPVTVRIAGSYSARARRAKEESRDQVFQRRGNIDADEATLLDRAVLIACIIEWDGFFVDEAEQQPYPFNAENALALLEASTWILEQLQAAHTNHAAFFRGA